MAVSETTPPLRRGLRRRIATPVVWRYPDLRTVWAASSISLFGSEITALVLPTLAVLSLHSSPLQVSLVETLYFVGLAAIGPAVGGVIDRTSRPGAMLVGHATALLAVASIPLVHALGHVTIGQVYAVAVVIGLSTSVFDIGAQAFIPEVVRTRSVDLQGEIAGANSAFELSRSGSRVAGPALAGLLVQALGAAFALVADALTYVVSVAALVRVRARRRGLESSPARVAAPAEPVPRVRSVRLIARDPLLSRVVVTTVALNFGGSIVGGVFFVFVYRDLGFSVGLLGVIMAAGNVGAVAGSAFAAWLGRRIGLVRTLQLATIALAGALWLLAAAPLGAAIALLVGYHLVFGVAQVIFGVSQASLRQLVAPAALQARIYAPMRTATVAAIPIGMTLGGVLGNHFTVLTAIVIGAAIASLAPLFAALVPRDDPRLV